MNRFRTLLFIAAVLFVSLAARGEERQVKSADGSIEAVCTITGKSGLIAETVEMTITVRQSTSDGEEPAAVQPPEFGSRYGDFDVAGVKSTPEIIAARAAQWGWVVSLEPVRAGQAVLPPIPITVTHSDGTSETLLLPAGTFPITSIHDPDSANLDALSAPRALKGPFPWRQVLVFCALAAILAAAAGLYLILRGHAGLRASEESIPELSPSRKALRDLDILVASGLAKINIAEFYLHLTRIVRTYIEETTPLMAREQTTEEFLRAARACPGTLDDRQRQALGEFLEFADLVKFARFQPTEEQIDDGVDKARRFVSETPGEARPDPGKAEPVPPAEPLPPADFP